MVTKQPLGLVRNSFSSSDSLWTEMEETGAELFKGGLQARLGRLGRESDLPYGSIPRD